MTDIREFQDADIGVLRRLIFETIDVSYAPVYPPRAIEFFKRFHAEAEIRARGRDGTTLVVEDDGALIATGSLVGDEILAVFVRPGVQRGGYGKALMQALEARACANGVTACTLSISLPSLEFYQGLGYEILEERARDLGDGQRLDFWKARKSLTPAAAG